MGRAHGNRGTDVHLAINVAFSVRYVVLQHILHILKGPTDTRFWGPILIPILGSKKTGY